MYLHTFPKSEETADSLPALLLRTESELKIKPPPPVINPNPEKYDLSQIVEFACELTGLNYKCVVSKKRDREIVSVKFALMYLLNNRYKLSWNLIMKLLKYDRTMQYSGIKNYEIYLRSNLKSDNAFKEAYQLIESFLPVHAKILNIPKIVL